MSTHDSRGQEFPAIAPKEGTRVVRRKKPGEDVPLPRQGKGVKFLGGGDHGKQDKGVTILDNH